MRIPKRKSEEDKRSLKKAEPLYATEDKIRSWERTIQKIIKEIPAAREELITTREMGDLSENAGYQIAKAKLRRLQHRKLVLEDNLKRVIQLKPESNEQIDLGLWIHIQSQTTGSWYRLVGPEEANPKKGYISYKSPLGEQLLHKKINDVVQLENGTTFTILAIERTRPKTGQ